VSAPPPDLRPEFKTRKVHSHMPKCRLVVCHSETRKMELKGHRASHCGGSYTTVSTERRRPWMQELVDVRRGPLDILAQVRNLGNHNLSPHQKSNLTDALSFGKRWMLAGPCAVVHALFAHGVPLHTRRVLEQVLRDGTPAEKATCARRIAGKSQITNKPN
jgi:hypothetical protein